MNTMSRLWPTTISCISILAVFCGRVAVAQPLATGKELKQGRIEHSQDVGSFPVNMIVSPDGQFAVTTDIGYRQSIWAIKLSDGAGQGPEGRRHRLRRRFSGQAHLLPCGGLLQPRLPGLRLRRLQGRRQREPMGQQRAHPRRHRRPARWRPPGQHLLQLGLRSRHLPRLEAGQRRPASRRRAVGRQRRLDDARR